jgi:hypothetical protein
MIAKKPEHKNKFYRGFEIQYSKYYEGNRPFVSTSILGKDARKHSYTVGIRTAHKFNATDFDDAEKIAKEWIDKRKEKNRIRQLTGVD